MTAPSQLTVPASPCASCPYRRDTPPGIWHESEYEKLRGYDTNERFEAFLCHQSNHAGKDMVCRGWLSVHAESVAARLAVCRGAVTGEELYATVKEPLYRTGNSAANAGLRGVKRPGIKARRKIETLSRLRKRAKRRKRP